MIGGKNEGNRNVNWETVFYNFDAIISVDYRVNFQRITKFRIWATDIEKDYIQKVFKIVVE